MWRVNFIIYSLGAFTIGLDLLNGYYVWAGIVFCGCCLHYFLGVKLNG